MYSPLVSVSCKKIQNFNIFVILGDIAYGESFAGHPVVILVCTFVFYRVESNGPNITIFHDRYSYPLR